jgi:hypothetical protein
LDTFEVIETECQAGLNTLTEHDFRDVFKKRMKRWDRCIRAERDYFEGDGGQLIFDQMEAPVSEIMDGSLYATYQKVS